MKASDKQLTLITAGTLALLGTLAAILWRPADGMMLTHDSLAYLHAADTLIKGEGLQYFGYNTPIIQWAPLTPALYGLIGLLSNNIQGWAAPINFLFLFGALFFANMAAREAVYKPLFCIPAQFVLSFSYAIILNFYYLWSEPLFFFFLTLLLWLFLRYLKDGGTGLVALTGAAAGLLMWTRYTGIGFSALTGVFILCLSERPFIRRLKDAMIYGAVAGIPFAGWLLRNLILSGSLTGRATPSLFSFSENGKNAMLRMAEWFIPYESVRSKAAVLFALPILAVLAGICLFIILRRDTKAIGLGVWFLAAHFAVYTIMTVYTGSRFALEGSTPRIMAPAFFFAAILLFLLLERAAKPVGKRAGITLAACAVAVAVCAAGLNTAALISRGPDLKGSFDREYLAADELIRYLETLNSGDILVYSDRPAEIYFMTGMNVNYPPKAGGVRLYTQDACLERLADSGRSPVVAWYSGQGDQMSKWIETLGLTQTLQFSKGAIYERLP